LIVRPGQQSYDSRSMRRWCGSRCNGLERPTHLYISSTSTHGRGLTRTPHNYYMDWNEPLVIIPSDALSFLALRSFRRNCWSERRSGRVLTSPITCPSNEPNRARYIFVADVFPPEYTLISLDGVRCAETSSEESPRPSRWPSCQAPLRAQRMPVTWPISTANRSSRLTLSTSLLGWMWGRQSNFVMPTPTCFRTKSIRQRRARPWR